MRSVADGAVRPSISNDETDNYYNVAVETDWLLPGDRPSLRGAKLRSQRAADHIVEIEAVVEQWITDNPHPITMSAPRDQVEAGSGIKPKIDWSQATPIPTTWVGIVAGEVLYNLRAGLDYLVHSLAWLDSRKPQLHTQFPITHTAASFQKQRRERLKGVGQTHVSLLEEYQPYRGCEWTTLLQELSNPDKHRTLTAVIKEFSGNFTVDRTAVQLDPQDRDRVIIPQNDIGVDLVFWNGKRVVETLKDLAIETANVIVRFQVDFGEDDQLTIRPP